MQLKRLLVLALLAQAAFGACASSWANGYAKCIEITIDHTKVPNTDQTDFPMHFCLNGPASSACDASLGTLTVTAVKGTGSGGSATSAICHDCAFFSDNSGTTLMSWEPLVVYSATTGAFQTWIKIPTLSHTTDGKIYLFVGNASVTTFQGGSAGAAWNANFRARYHFGDGTNLVLTDSTAAALTLTNTSTVVGSGPLIGTGSAIVTTATHFANTTASTGAIVAWGLSAWIKSTQSGAVGNYIKVSTSTGAGQEYLNFSTTGKPTVGDAGGGGGRATGTTSVNTGSWFHIWGTHDGTSFRIYVNGALETTVVTSLLPGNDGIWIGRENNGADTCGCTIAEGAFINGAPSGDWIAADYNSQGSPSTFYSVAAPASGSHPYSWFDIALNFFHLTLRPAV